MAPLDDGSVLVLELITGSIVRASGEKFANRKTVVSGLQAPVQMVLGPDGQVYVTELGGKLLRERLLCQALPPPPAALPEPPRSEAARQLAHQRGRGRRRQRVLLVRHQQRHLPHPPRAMNQARAAPGNDTRPIGGIPDRAGDQ